jgi:hypothetical protein
MTRTAASQLRTTKTRTAKRAAFSIPEWRMGRASFSHIVEVLGGLSEQKQERLCDGLAFLAGMVSGINKGSAAVADAEPDRPEVIAHAARVSALAQKLESAIEHPPRGYDAGEAAMRAARKMRSVAEEAEKRARESKRKKAGRKRSFARDAALSEVVWIYAELGFVPATTKGGPTARFCEAVFEGFGLPTDGIDSALPAAVAESRRRAREEAEKAEIARAEASSENAGEK